MDIETDVLAIGAGPVGTSAAIKFGIRGRWIPQCALESVMLAKAHTLPNAESRFRIAFLTAEHPHAEPLR